MTATRKYLRVEISGESTSDLEISIEEVKRKIADGYLSGFDSNDTADYEFNLTEELSQPAIPAPAGDDK